MTFFERSIEELLVQSRLEALEPESILHFTIGAMSEDAESGPEGLERVMYFLDQLEELDKHVKRLKAEGKA